MRLSKVFFLLTLIFAVSAQAEPASITFIAPANESMPLAHIENGTLTGGIIKDLGDAIAARMGLQARYHTLPGARVGQGLSLGLADSLCYALPHWLDGDFLWSQPIIDDAEMIVARADTPRINHMTDLADQKTGTVIAYHYPAVSEPLHNHFRRDDSETMELNIKKILAGRLKYAIVEKLPFEYALRQSPSSLLRTDLVFSRFKAMCAFSRRSPLAFSDFNAAIDGLLADGTIEQILSAYR